MTRSNWTQNEILKILNLPLTDLIYKAQKIHKKNFPKNDVQLASLLSIKTGFCPENCKYCPQSAHYKTAVKKETLLSVKEVLKKAKKAKSSGASRFCMGAAWREVKDGPEFNKVIKMVEGIKNLGMESCVTLGMLNQKQANKLAKAGLKAYNHNIDTSPDFYRKKIPTRKFQDRIDTITKIIETPRAIFLQAIKSKLKFI